MTVYDSSVRAVRALLVVANRTCFTRCASQSSRHPCRILDQLRVRPARYSNPEYVGDLCDAWYSLERSPLHSALGLVIIDPRNREPPLLEARILLFIFDYHRACFEMCYCWAVTATLADALQFASHHEQSSCLESTSRPCHARSSSFRNHSSPPWWRENSLNDSYVIVPRWR